MTLDLGQWWTLPRFDGDLRPIDLYTPQHVGLYLDRCLPLPYVAAPRDGYDDKTQKALKDSKANRVAAYTSAIAALRPRQKAAEAYRARFTRWRKALGQEAPLRGVRVIELETTSRLLLHPSANQSITDGAVLMHHTYGAPYLPGSGLKGLTRAQARRDGEEAEVINALFGPERAEGGEPGPDDAAALVRFLDALWIPEAPKGAMDSWSPLELDVVTPHHSAYYTGDEPPGDWQQPVPTQRLTVAPGARFCVILEGCPAPKEQTEEWLDLAERLLRRAVAELGFGAYTRAGFGRMKAEGEPTRLKSGATGAVTASEWEKAHVVLNRGSGALTVMLLAQGNKKVATSAAEGQQLVAALEEERRAQLRKKGELRMEVRVEPLGATWRVVGLK